MIFLGHQTYYPWSRLNRGTEDIYPLCGCPLPIWWQEKCVGAFKRRDWADLECRSDRDHESDDDASRLLWPVLATPASFFFLSVFYLFADDLTKRANEKEREREVRIFFSHLALPPQNFRVQVNELGRSPRENWQIAPWNNGELDWKKSAGDVFHLKSRSEFPAINPNKECFVVEICSALAYMHTNEQWCCREFPSTNPQRVVQRARFIASYFTTLVCLVYLWASHLELEF